MVTRHILDFPGQCLTEMCLPLQVFPGGHCTSKDGRRDESHPGRVLHWALNGSWLPIPLLSPGTTRCILDSVFWFIGSKLMVWGGSAALLCGLALGMLAQKMLSHDNASRFQIFRKRYISPRCSGVQGIHWAEVCNILCSCPTRLKAQALKM